MPTAVRSSRKNGIAERLVGSIGREFPDGFIIINQRYLYKLLEEYIEYDIDEGTHLSLGKEPLAECPVQEKQSDDDNLILLPRCDGLHHKHKYEWRQAA